MLDIARAPEHHRSLIVFFDHADESMRYVVPDAPRLVERPDPRLSLILFRSDTGSASSAGGLLQLESSLAATKEELDQLRRELSAAGRVPVLATPDWRTGTVEVAGWLAGSVPAPLSLALAPPSLVGDPMVVLCARLDEAAAELAAVALRGGALPLVLMWKLETLGLAGPLGIEMEADLQAMHQRLTAQGALTTPIGQAKIIKTWEAFASEQLIRTHIVDKSGDVDSNRAEALRRVGEDLTSRMFTPSPPPEAPALLADGSIAPIELSFRLTHRKEELEQTRCWSYRERRAIPVTHYAAASLTALLHGRLAPAYIFTADLTPFRRDIVVRVEPELDALAIAALEVDLEWPDSAQLNRTLVMTPDKIEQRFTINREPGEVVRYRVRARFDAARTRAQDRQSAWMDAVGDLIAISARRLFPARTLSVAIGRGEMSWMDTVQVDVTAPLEPQRSLILTKARPRADANFPGAGDGPLRFAAHWRGVQGEPSRMAAPFESTEDFIILDSPFDDSIAILAVPLPMPGLLNITLDLQIENDALNDTKQLSWDDADRSAKDVALRRLSGSPRTYRYRVTLMHEDGTIDEQPWLQTGQRTIVIGATKPARVIAADVVVLGGGPAGRGSLGIELTLAAGADRTVQLLEGDVDQARLILVTDQNAPEAELAAREFLKSGRILQTVWAPVDAINILGLGAPAEMLNPTQ